LGTRSRKGKSRERGGREENNIDSRGEGERGWKSREDGKEGGKVSGLMSSTLLSLCPLSIEVLTEIDAEEPREGREEHSSLVFPVCRSLLWVERDDGS